MASRSKRCLVVGNVMLALLFAIIAGFAIVAGATADETTSSAAASAVGAVQQLLESDGSIYAGDCAGARSPDDIGKVCSRLVAQQAELYAFETGRTFSEFDRWVFVGKTSGGWQVLVSSPLREQTAPAKIPWPSAGSPGAGSAGS